MNPWRFSSHLSIEKERASMVNEKDYNLLLQVSLSKK